MSLTLRALLLIICLSIGAQAQTRRLALYTGPARGLDADSDLVMRAELQRLLTPAGLDVIWKNAADYNSGGEFELLAVGTFEGSCSAAGPVLTPENTVHTVRSLADTSISEGHILPYFQVDCRRLIGMLGTGIDKATLGRALARVISHELYHIVAGTTEHRDTGVAKATFSLRDLIKPRFDFDMLSLAQMNPLSITPIADSEASGR